MKNKKKLTKRQKRNRKIIERITILIIFLQGFLSFGIVGNIETDQAIPKTAIIIYIILTILSFILIKICEKF